MSAEILLCEKEPNMYFSHFMVQFVLLIYSLLMNMTFLVLENIFTKENS